MSRRSVFFPIGLVIIACLFVAIRSQVIDPQMKTSDVAGSHSAHVESSQIDSNESPQHQVIKSPTGRHLAFYGPYDSYRTKPDPLLFTIVDTVAKSDVHVPIEWPARYVSSVDWIDDSFLLVRGEGAFLAIIDVSSGRQTHSLIGHDFSVAPNNAALIYRYDFNPLKGEISAYLQSDYVLLTSLGVSRGLRSPKNNYRVVYPEYLNWGTPGEKLYPKPNTRHHVVSEFAWSADSKRLAFAENTEHGLWVTMLNFITLHDMRPIATRFKLDVETKETVNLSWLSLSEIRVTSGNANWTIDVGSRTVVHQ